MSHWGGTILDLNQHQFVDMLAVKSGLDPLTIRDLLDQGWIFHEKADGQPVCWEHPSQHE